MSRKMVRITSISGSGLYIVRLSRIQTRIDRMEFGNFGDCKSVGRGVFELRVDFGPGYRLYFGQDGDDLVILLGGRTKKRQSRDIAQAHIHWKAYKQEKTDAY